MPRNDLDQPVGVPVDWAARSAVAPVTLTGQHCRLEPYGPAHLAALHEAVVTGSPASTWTYLRPPVPRSSAELGAVMDDLLADPGAVPLVICGPDGTPLGTASYLRADPGNGVVEVGWIVFAAALQRTTAATEAMFLMMRHVFDDLGYRRYEWKCDSLNQPSRRAAERLGFTYEGTFRNAQVYKGRNRDTAWFSVTDAEWPVRRDRFEAWLRPANFDASGDQRSPLDVRA